jgi:hypothetical protein
VRVHLLKCSEKNNGGLYLQPVFKSIFHVLLATCCIAGSPMSANATGDDDGPAQDKEVTEVNIDCSR